MDPYPNTTMLQIIEGERAGVPVLPPVGVDWSGAPPAKKKLPGTLGAIVDIVGAILAPARKAAEAGTKAGVQIGGKAAEAVKEAAKGDDPDCFLPTPLGCLLSRDTATLVGVNILLLVALVAGVLLLAGKPTVAAVGKVADVAL